MGKSNVGNSISDIRNSKMSLTLTQSPDELREIFRNLKQPEDIAEMRDVTYRDLNYWIYRTPEQERYSTFTIPKKFGSPRQIDTPNINIKILQQKLNQVLQSVYTVKPSVHGFALGKSVKTNATQHTQKQWVFNTDLENFFPSIHFGRVRGMLMSTPYGLSEKVATVLAHLCCFQGQLPQGAPTSPIISNMLCAKMDSELQRLAKANRSTYTRYADDITFSTTSRRFPPDLASLDDLNQVQIGKTLRDIIERNGFTVNENKIWLSGRNRRQEVTGVTVNDFPNISKRFKNQIRAMLYVWRRHGLEAAQETWEKKNAHRHRAPWTSPPRFEQVLKGKIEYLGMIKGQDSLTYLKFLDQLGDLDPSMTGGRGTPLRLLLREYHDLQAYDDVSDKSKKDRLMRKRGHDFEKLIVNTLKLSPELTVSGGFTRNDGAEQIDSAFTFDGTSYLIECKWWGKKVGRPVLDELNGKIGRSGAGTSGLLISVNGWSNKVVSTLKQNQNKRIILMDGDDVYAILMEKISFAKMMREKVEALALKSEPFISVGEIMQNNGIV